MFLYLWGKRMKRNDWVRKKELIVYTCPFAEEDVHCANAILSVNLF